MRFMNVGPFEITKSMLDLLDPAVALDYDDRGQLDVLSAVMKGTMHFWLIVPSHGEDATGVFTTTRVERKAGDTLFVGYLCGTNVISNMDDLLECFDKLARDLNCTHVEAEFSNTRLLEEVQKRGFETYCVRAARKVRR